MEDEFHLRRSTRNIARNNHSTPTPDDEPSGTTPLPDDGDIEPVAQYRDATDLLQGAPFFGGANRLENPSSQHTVANAPNPGEKQFTNRFPERESSTTPTRVTDDTPATGDTFTPTPSAGETARRWYHGLTPTQRAVGETRPTTSFSGETISRHTAERRDVIRRATQSQPRTLRRSGILVAHRLKMQPSLYQRAPTHRRMVTLQHRAS